MFSIWEKMAASLGAGVPISSLKKVKIFDFSCTLVTDFNVLALLEYVAQI